MPMYNSQDYVGDAISSVIAQTYPDWELLVIDDCSTDDSSAVVEQYMLNEPRIRLNRLDTNSGAGLARNRGIELASGEYIAFLDADDYWESAKLARQVEFMQRTSAAISYTSYSFIDNQGQPIRGKVKAVPRMDRDMYMRTTGIGLSTSMLYRPACGEFRFDKARTRQDLIFWIELLGNGIQAQGIDEVLVKYRIRPGQISGNKLRAAWTTLKYYWHYDKISFPRRMLNYFFYLTNAVVKRLTY